jgi:cytochrome c oxidase subunit 2
MEGPHILVEQASTFAGESDALFFTLVTFAFVIGAFLTILIVFYSVKYRRGSRASRMGRRSRNMPLEFGWTAAATVIAFVLFGWGADLFAERARPPPNALHILGLGKQWMWSFEHPGGQREIDELHVPVGQSVVVELASQDVIHSFFVPAFRIKQDAVPGMSTSVWFEATKPGIYQLFCSEFCGTQHSEMHGTVVAMEPERFTGWLDLQPAGDDLAAQGGKLFRALGCSGCHQNGTVRAPDLANIYGHPVALSDSNTVIADTRYIRDSILDPNKEIAAGYAAIMPSFAGVIGEDELQELVAYIRSLSDQEARS